MVSILPEKYLQYRFGEILAAVNSELLGRLLGLKIWLLQNNRPKPSFPNFNLSFFGSIAPQPQQSPNAIGKSPDTSRKGSHPTAPLSPTQQPHHVTSTLVTPSAARSSLSNPIDQCPKPEGARRDVFSFAHFPLSLPTGFSLASSLQCRIQPVLSGARL